MVGRAPVPSRALDETSKARIGSIKRSIAEIRALRSRMSIEQIAGDAATRAAFERFVGIVSDASRDLPTAWKKEHRNVAWRRVTSAGDAIYYGYDRVDLSMLWQICERELTPLENALDAMLARYGQGGPP